MGQTPTTIRSLCIGQTPTTVSVLTKRISAYETSKAYENDKSFGKRIEVIGIPPKLLRGDFFKIMHGTNTHDRKRAYETTKAYETSKNYENESK